MPETNIEIVRAMFEPFEGVNVAGFDWGAVAMREVIQGAYSPDIELTTLQSGIGTGIDEHYQGLDGLVSYLREWLEPFTEYYVTNLDFIDAGECVLVPSRQRGVGGGSGAEVVIELTTLYELRDGRIVRMHQYDTLADAREAAAAA